MEILGYELRQTCGACPEQYDVYKDGKEVAYLRLRHGHFSASMDGEVVYAASPKGDGIFDSEEREHYLTEAIKAVIVAKVTASEGDGASDSHREDPYARKRLKRPSCKCAMCGRGFFGLKRRAICKACADKKAA